MGDKPAYRVPTMAEISALPWNGFNVANLYYVTRVGDKPFTIPQDQTFHILGLTLDGINGLSPIEHQRQTVGISLALERFASMFFGRGANLGGVIETPPMNPEAARSFLEDWRKAYTSPDNWFKIGTLPPGMKFHQTTTTPEDAQAVQSRVHQIREVARIFRVPPHKLMDLERATFSNIEHQAIEFMQETIRPWAIRFESEAERKLLLEIERPRLEIKFNLDALLRADTSSRYAAHAAGLNAGFITVNEVREKEGLPPVEGGDDLRVPLNMAPARAADETGANRSLIEDTARRILTKESKALIRAAKKHQGDELRAWAEQWYASHTSLVARTIAPVLRAAGIDTPPDEYAARHVEESKRAIAQAIEAGADINDLTDEWADIRPAEIANDLTTKGE